MFIFEAYKKIRSNSKTSHARSLNSLFIVSFQFCSEQKAILAITRLARWSFFCGLLHNFRHVINQPDVVVNIGSPLANIKGCWEENKTNKTRRLHHNFALNLIDFQHGLRYLLLSIVTSIKIISFLLPRRYCLLEHSVNSQLAIVELFFPSFSFSNCSVLSKVD